MSFFKVLFRIVLGLLALLIIVGLLLPSSATIDRSIDINAAPEKVFPHVNAMRAFNAWSPWTDLDPETVYQFEGPEEGVGSRVRWESDDASVGAGSQEITLSEINSKVVTSLFFGEQDSGTATFLLSPNDRGGTHIIWRFYTDFGWNLFGRYFGLMLENLLGGNYEKGLNKLKQIVESES